MALDSDGLLDHLLFSVALTGEQGLDIRGLSQAVQQFYARLPEEIVQDDATTEDDILFSLNPPGCASSRRSQASDPQHLDKLWTWLVDHPDINITTSKINVTTADQVTSQASSGYHELFDLVFQAHADQRLCANESRLWQALTDHGIDYRRIPKLEFRCLSVIAAAGPGGLLQPDVTRLTGQDKRSVPKRTDALAQKGLITKELCVGLGIKTSVLIFKKFIQQGEAQTMFEVGGDAGHTPKNGVRRMIRYDEWFSEIIGHLKKNSGTIAVEDLRKEMGIHGKKWETRSLHRCLRRLGRSGLILKVKRRTAPTEFDAEQEEVDADSEVDAEADADADAEADTTMGAEHEFIDDRDDPEHKVAPKRKRVRKSHKVRWTRCIDLLRDPTEKDKAAFTSHAAAERANEVVADDSDDDQIDDGDATDYPSTNFGPSKDKPQTKQRVPPQWHPGVHHTQLLFNLIESCGTDGISTMDLTDRAMGHFWRRPLDELLGRLTDVWQISQPAHLRHLGVVRDTAFLARTSHYLFRSFGNFKKLVDSGDVTWDAIQIEKSAIDNEVVDFDPWGFPRVKPATMANAEGTGNMMHCKQTIVKPSYRRTWDGLKRGQGAPASTQTVTPRKPRALPAKSRPSTTTPALAWLTDSRPSLPSSGLSPVGDLQTNSMSIVATRPNSQGPAASPAIQTPESRALRDILATPKRRTRNPSAATGTGKSNVKILFKMNPKRVDAEMKEWRARANRLAKALAKAEPRTSPHSTDMNSSDLTNLSRMPKEESTNESNSRSSLLRDEHVAEIESEILSMSKPGAYINPPGSGQLKMSITMPTGRPSRYMIAVVKSKRLQELPWFTQEPDWPVPLPGRTDRGSRTPDADLQYPSTYSSTHTGSVTTEKIASPDQSTADSISPIIQPQEPTPDFSIKGGRKRRTRVSLMERIVKRQATMSTSGGPVYVPPNLSIDAQSRGVHVSVDTASNGTQQHSQTPNISSQRSTGLYTGIEAASRLTPGGQIQNRVESSIGLAPALPTAAMPLEASKMKHSDDDRELRVERPRVAAMGQHDKPLDVPMPDIPVAADNGADQALATQDLPPATRRTSVLYAEEANAHHLLGKEQVLLRDPASPTKAGADTSPAIPADQAKHGDAEISEAAVEPTYFEILSLEQVLVSTAQTPNPRSKVGVPRSGGIIKHQRAETVLNIIHNNGGVFGGDKELLLPFIWEWEKNRRERPDRHTLARVIASLVSDGRLKKLAFTFEAKDGKTIKKHILTEPRIDKQSEVVKSMLQNIIRKYPNMYVPGDYPVNDYSQVHIRNEIDPEGRNKKSEQLTVRDHFPEDASGFISRLHPSTRAPVAKKATVVTKVKLGMTEAKLERDMTMRKRRREQEVRRQERYLRAQQVEEIEDAQNALQTDFQLDSYHHEPDLARVDRGPRGRGRLSKLQRWGASDRTTKKKALGLLGAATDQEMADQVEEELLGIPSAAGRRRIRPSHLLDAITRERSSVVRKPKRAPVANRTKFAPAGGFYSDPPTTVQSSFGSTIVEVFTMTTPYQRFYPQSGTFSTDPLVITAASKPVRNGATAQLGVPKEQLSMSLADIFRQADFDTSNSLPAGSPAHHLVNSTTKRLPAIGSSLDNTHRQSPMPGWQRLSRFSPARWAPFARNTAPRASRSGIFVMSEAEEQRLIMAVVVVRSLLGGLQNSSNWGFVHQIFHYKFEANYCRNRWAVLRGRHSGTVDKLQGEFQELFIEAYERGEVPEIDFVEPEKYDWVGVVDWAEARLDSGRIESMANELPDLIHDRKLLENSYEVKLPEELYGIGKEDYWLPLVTHLRREELANAWTHSAPLKTRLESLEEDPLMLAKSWVRANVLTPDSAFDRNAAHNKLMKLGGDTLPKAIDELLGAKIIRMENKGRAIPGRNYDISDTVLATFKRTWDANHLRLAAAFKDTVDSAFATEGKLEVSYTAPDHDVLGMTNLVASGRARVVPRLPKVNNDFDAEWPRLSKWGFTDGNYKTVQMDKGRLHFQLELHPTESYVFGCPIKCIDPPLSFQVEGEMGARLPLWTDINGKLIQSVWDMMVMATLHILAFRPGITAEVMATSYKNKLWVWEIELFLRWAEEVGLTRRVGDGPEPGWTTAEWWWLAFANQEQQRGLEQDVEMVT